MLFVEDPIELGGHDNAPRVVGEVKNVHCLPKKTAGAWQQPKIARLKNPAAFIAAPVQALLALNGRIKKPQKFHKNRRQKAYCAGSYSLQSATPHGAKSRGITLASTPRKMV
jgi:hypothetical protein